MKSMLQHNKINKNKTKMFRSMYRLMTVRYYNRAGLASLLPTDVQYNHKGFLQ